MEFLRQLMAVVTLDHVLTLMGLAVPLLSAAASWVNHAVRVKLAAGAQVPTWFLKVGAGLNLLAVNLDKAAQLTKMSKPPAPPCEAPPAPVVPMEDVVAQIEEAAAPPEPPPAPVKKPRGKSKKQKSRKKKA
jgi:hypothetical protein